MTRSTATTATRSQAKALNRKIAAQYGQAPRAGVLPVPSPSPGARSWRLARPSKPISENPRLAVAKLRAQVSEIPLAGAGESEERVRNLAVFQAGQECGARRLCCSAHRLALEHMLS